MKIKISVKPKLLPCPQISQQQKKDINTYIFKHKLQTEQRMFVVIDEYLSTLCNLDVDSVHKINIIHNALALELKLKLEADY